MDEREAWRPRIFYSSGPNQGLPEPFPPPTHMRRKERSYFNRGALFVPNNNSPGETTTSGPGAHQRYRVQGRFTTNNNKGDEGKNTGGGGGGLSLNGNTATATVTTGGQQRWLMMTRNSSVPHADNGGEGESSESAEASGG